MSERARPPDDIAPIEFFTRWVPAAVEADPERSRRLGDTEAAIVFVLERENTAPASFTLEIAGGRVTGRAGAVASPSLEVRVDEPTWRALNRGEISAPEAMLKRRLRVSGNLVLALKLHLILG